MPPVASPSRGPIRILVVDDHPFFREGMVAWIGRQSSLEYCGYADAPDGALVAIENLKPDLVLLDLQLRNSNGLDLLQSLLTRTHAPQVIVVSHKDETIYAERAVRAGAQGYVSKDEASEVMMQAIRTVLNGGIHLSPRMLAEQSGRQNIAASGPLDRVRRLYDRELQVLESLGRGSSTKEIARDMGISPKTVESYRESLKHKLGFADGHSLIRFATLWQHENRPPAK